MSNQGQSDNGDWVGMAINEFGTEVSVHICAWCGNEFTVCPPKRGDFRGCLATNCESYDPDRDADKLFEEGADIVRLPNSWPPVPH